MDLDIVVILILAIMTVLIFVHWHLPDPPYSSDLPFVSVQKVAEPHVGHRVTGPLRVVDNRSEWFDKEMERLFGAEADEVDTFLLIFCGDGIHPLAFTPGRLNIRELAKTWESIPDQLLMEG